MPRCAPAHWIRVPSRPACPARRGRPASSPRAPERRWQPARACAGPPATPARPARVPGPVQAFAATGADPCERYRHEVAAAVAVVRRMQRLVDVTDQVHDPLERLVPLPLRGVGVPHHGHESLELPGIALPLRTVARFRSAGANGRVIVMPAGPRGGCSGYLVRPVGHRLEHAASRGSAELVPIVAQQFRHGGARRRAQQPLRDGANRAMPQPSPRRGARGVPDSTPSGRVD
jgi:hypothetical protein